jgi:AAA+ superfamily predicted ATPase
MNASVAEPLYAVPPSEPPPSWSERNQQWLVREVRWLAGCIEGRSSQREVSDAADFVPALTHLVELFGLSEFERNVLLLAAGVEIDSGLLRVVAAVSEGAPPRASFSLALARLPQAHWDAMSPRGPLRYWNMLTLEPAASLTDAALRIDERILHYLTGVTSQDEALEGVVRRLEVTGDLRALPERWLARLGSALLSEGAPVLIALDRAEGMQPGEDRVIVAASLARLGLDALFLRAHDLPSDAKELAAFARHLDRESALTRAVPVIDLDALCDGRADHETRAASLIGELRGGVLVLGQPSRELLATRPERTAMRLTLPASDSARLVNAQDACTARALKRAMHQFNVSEAAIETALASLDPGEGLGDEAGVDREIWQALRVAARGGLDTLAQRICSHTTFDDLVLPPAQLNALRTITHHLRHRERVFVEWGFAEKSARGLGLCALFAGESGTGKTLAAEAIANASGLDLYRIDLATVVSKYIGETEKNLRRLFDAAEASGAVLLFDEADALFGKRSEVKDSHDRYANIEVAYLLQRIEAYRGLAILTTNMKSALDRAFMRRIRFVVQFPFPDPTAREAIWQRQIPARAPVSGIDFRALGRLQLAGGNIRSIVLSAAFRAADEGRAIDQELLIDAARAEFAKLERGFTET